MARYGRDAVNAMTRTVSNYAIVAVQLAVVKSLRRLSAVRDQLEARVEARCITSCDCGCDACVNAWIVVQLALAEVCRAQQVLSELEGIVLSDI